MTTHYPTTVTGRTIKDPAIARFLFSDVRSAWIWLILRNAKKNKNYSLRFLCDLRVPWVPLR